MADFQFIKNKLSKKWLISALRRAGRPNIGHQALTFCPFCVGEEAHEKEVFRLGGSAQDSNWHIRVIQNRFPFAPIHEIVVHSPDHHKNIDELPFSQVELLLQTYRQRYNTHKDQGQVYIFHNRGIAAGESLPHPHTQIAVIPHDVTLEISPLDRQSMKTLHERQLLTEHFAVFCPATSEWPDEVWIAPQQNGRGFGALHDVELSDLAYSLSRVIQLFDVRHGHEFPFNFYISPGKDWYVRIIPRVKILGGFEVGTGLIVNTQDPNDTFRFIRQHFWEPDVEMIRTHQNAEYWKSV